MKKTFRIFLLYSCMVVTFAMFHAAGENEQVEINVTYRDEDESEFYSEFTLLDNLGNIYVELGSIIPKEEKEVLLTETLLILCSSAQISAEPEYRTSIIFLLSDYLSAEAYWEHLQSPIYLNNIELQIGKHAREAYENLFRSKIIVLRDKKECFGDEIFKEILLNIKACDEHTTLKALLNLMNQFNYLIAKQHAAPFDFYHDFYTQKHLFTDDLALLRYKNTLQLIREFTAIRLLFFSLAEPQRFSANDKRILFACFKNATKEKLYIVLKEMARETSKPSHKVLNLDVPISWRPQAEQWTTEKVLHEWMLELERIFPERTKAKYKPSLP